MKILYQYTPVINRRQVFLGAPRPLSLSLGHNIYYRQCTERSVKAAKPTKCASSSIRGPSVEGSNRSLLLIYNMFALQGLVTVAAAESVRFVEETF